MTASVSCVLCVFFLSCAIRHRSNDENFIGSRRLSPSLVKQGDGEAAPESGNSAPVAVSAEGPITVTVEQSILLSLGNNRALKVERLNPAIRRASEEEQQAVFDPVLAAELYRSRDRIEKPAGFGGEKLKNESYGELTVSEYLPWGTTVGLSLSTGQTWSDLYSDDLFATRLGMSVTQALLRGAGIEYNLASLRQAKIDTKSSQYELRGFAETLVAQVEEAYWNYALTRRQIDIFLESLNLAEQQKAETQEIIRIGALAESELAAAEAEIALRREGLINAKSALEKNRLQLLRLLNPPADNLWKRDLVLLDLPMVPNVTLDDVEAHVQVALRMRSDLNQARLQAQRGDLDIVKTKNGLLPKMDFFIELGKGGYAGSFGRSIGNIDEKSYDVLAGLSFEYPFMNREAGAKHRASILNREQAEESLHNLAQIVQVDVRSAYIEVNRTREQIAATRATRALQEEKVRIETEKFRVGKSTTLMVAQAQRDLLSSRISEISAVTNYLKAIIELYRLEGSLLERRGIMAPGGEPVVLERRTGGDYR